MDQSDLLAQLKEGIAAIESGRGPSFTEKGAPSVHGAMPDAEPSDEKGGSANKGPLSAFQRIVALVNASDKSEHAIRQRLAQKDYPPAEVEEAIERAKACGFIDDERFASLLIQSRINQCKGSRGIERELRANGIDPQTIDGWPDSFALGFDEELERALTMLHRHPPRSKNLREGAYRKAIQKGFPSSVASSAARLWMESTAQ